MKKKTLLYALFLIFILKNNLAYSSEIKNNEILSEDKVHHEENAEKEKQEKEEQKTHDLLLNNKIINTEKNDEILFAVNFTNASLKTILNDLGKILKINFIPDDIVKDGITATPARDLENIKITYSASQKMNEAEIKKLLSQFLAISDLTTQPIPNLKNYYRVTSTTNSNRLALPTYIGISFLELPQTGRIRYIYFLANTSAVAMQAVISKLKSNSAIVDIFKDLNALIITDEAYNISAMMKIVKELDERTVPETLSIIRLKDASAQEVVELYENLKSKDDPFKRSFNQKDTHSAKYYFSQDIHMIAEHRSNSLIILGSKDSVEKIEKFILENIDINVANHGKRIHTVKIQFSEAEQIATILTAATKFATGKEISQSGGTRSGQHYFSDISFQADLQTNTLLIFGTNDDINAIIPIIKKLDQRQPQVSLEILIINVDYSIIKRMGTAIRNPFPGAVNFQSVTYRNDQVGAVTDPDTGSLLGNLIGLASSSGPGSFVLSLGRESVWALFNIQEQINSEQRIARPFLTTVNKCPATVKFAVSRRIPSAIVVSGGTNNDQTENMSLEAAVEVKITPQISSDGTISMAVKVTEESFSEPLNPSSGNKYSRVITTNADVKDGQVLAIGGISQVQDEYLKNAPGSFLSNIPILGNLFTARREQSESLNLLVLIFPTIINPGNEGEEVMRKITNTKSRFVEDVLNETRFITSPRDPIYQWFFNPEQKLSSNSHKETFNEISKNTEKSLLQKKENLEPESVLDWIKN
jgi:type II secretory pathway component GspD/PulD (secretin)